MIYKAEINGLPVEAYYSEDSIQNIFLPLLRKLTEIQKQKGGRVLAMLAAPPGSGKSTLLNFLQHLSETQKDITPITIIGMDGFHHYQKYLDCHTMIRDGQEYLMKEYKGAPETFDLSLLTERLKKVSGGEVCGWPEYYRIAHDPIDDAITVDGDIVIIEGNYLLLNWEGWKDLSSYADYTIKIVADENLLKNRLVNRKTQSGISKEDAERFVERSDLYNVRTCLRDSLSVNLVLELIVDDSYRKIESPGEMK
ncbi:MAG: nucleoside/nucleotide kinase family protein [Eubacteriales bacterium]|nr:nucleoside/nucleotide kinase family protein [Eubacteriales bacterium]